MKRVFIQLDTGRILSYKVKSKKRAEEMVAGRNNVKRWRYIDGKVEGDLWTGTIRKPGDKPEPVQKKKIENKPIITKKELTELQIQAIDEGVAKVKAEVMQESIDTTPIVPEVTHKPKEKPKKKWYDIRRYL